MYCINQKNTKNNICILDPIVKQLLVYNIVLNESKTISL